MLSRGRRLLVLDRTVVLRVSFSPLMVGSGRPPAVPQGYCRTCATVANIGMQTTPSVGGSRHGRCTLHAGYTSSCTSPRPPLRVGRCTIRVRQWTQAVGPYTAS